MSAFSFNTTYQPTGDQQKDAIAQIDIMQNRAVQANLAYPGQQRPAGSRKWRTGHGRGAGTAAG
ncbi:hypothetical protein DQF27_16095 [Escherichia coli]|nr:hypothetical protein [Escherichia coli]MLI07939.1 hypothetical protein [Escherichia coli]